MLRLTNASYRYAGAARLSLAAVDLDVGDGEIVGVVGASESGKTTLCLVASGLAPRSIGGTLTGALSVDGVVLSPERPMHEIAALVGMSFQNPATQLSQVSETVYEEVAFGALNLGLERAEVIARTSAALETLRIEHLAQRDPRQLSGGQQQLVAVAGLLAMRPRHLVLDEPTAQLDPEGTHLVGEALSRLAESGTGLLITEHDTDLLARVCSRVAVLGGGAIVFAGEPRAVFADRRLAGLGVDPPAAVTLSRALNAAGLDPGMLA